MDTPPHRNRWAVSGLVMLLTLTLFVRVFNPTGWLGSDDSGYFAAAEQIQQGEPIQRVHHHYARMAMIVPVALSISIFGSTPTAVWLPSLLASLLCVTLVAWIGEMLWGWREGLLAALIVSMIPYFRVLSTAGFPDVHVCLWTAGSLALAIRGLGCAHTKNAFGLLLASGMCAAIATLTKILTAPLAVAIILFIFRGPCRSKVGRWRFAGVFCAGGVAAVLIEGLFFRWAAGDFLFNYHAHVAALHNVPVVGLTGAPATASTWNLAMERLTMMFHPLVSGWGTIAVGFWGVCAVAIAFRTTRWLALWSVLTYLLLAICPVGIKDGAIRLNPVFHGRHILPLCIPFALCAAHLVGRIGRAKFAAIRRGAFPMAAVCVLGFAVSDRHHLNGFIHRPTSRVGRAITEMIHNVQWDREDCDRTPIFMTPSTYWRYRILFPKRLRSRLAVASDPHAPNWWMRTTSDIVQRQAPLPQPQEAYLIATPRQLRGLPEQWDYGVSLPRRGLAAWRNVSPRVVIARLKNNTIQRVPASNNRRNRLVLLLGGPATGETVANLTP